MAYTLPTQQIISDLKEDEGVEDKPYVDTVGKITIGVGRNLTDVGLREDEIEYLLKNDIKEVIELLQHYLPWTLALPPLQKRAIINMCFQLGIYGLMKFKKMLKYLEEEDFERASREALDSRWAIQTPNRAKRVAALIRGEDTYGK